MGEKKEDEGEPEEWSDLEWHTPDEQLDDVLVPVENDDEEVDPSRDSNRRPHGCQPALSQLSYGPWMGFSLAANS